MTAHCDSPKGDMLDAVTSARAGFGFAGVHQGKCLIGTVGRVACARAMALRPPVGTKYCGECGTKMAVEKAFCTNCGEELQSGAKFCGECGTKQGSTA